MSTGPRPRPAPSGAAGGPTATASCPQCGSPFELRLADPFARCPACRATLYVALDRIVVHLTLRPRLGAGEAQGALDRYLRAAEVDVARSGPPPALEFHPWWVVQADDGPSLVQGAPDTAFAQAPRRAAEIGDASPFDAEVARNARVVAPVLAVEEAAAHVAGGRVEGARLLHVPMWRIDFHDGHVRHRAIVDAVEGVVDAVSLPPSSTRRMDRDAVGWFVVAIAVFAVEAAVLPGLLLPLAAFAVTGWGIFEFVRRAERGNR